MIHTLDRFKVYKDFNDVYVKVEEKAKSMDDAEGISIAESADIVAPHGNVVHGREELYKYYENKVIVRNFLTILSFTAVSAGLLLKALGYRKGLSLSAVAAVLGIAIQHDVPNNVISDREHTEIDFELNTITPKKGDILYLVR